MNKLLIVLVIIQLMLGAYCCGRTDEKSEMETKVKEEVTSMEKKATGEAKQLEEDVGMLEENPKKLGEEMGKEEEKVPAPQEEWGHESDPVVE